MSNPRFRRSFHMREPSDTTKTRSRPSPYPSLPFIAVRTISVVSSLIVIGILAFFSRQLWADGYKIPWTFIVVMLGGLINIVVILLTSIISCCATLSPILNILLNIPVLILWVISITILTWNMYGTLGHTCSITNWGNARGVMVCNIYKTLYAFVVIANLAHIAQLVLDIRARRNQVRRGKYGKMDNQDIKIDDLKPLAPKSVHDGPMASEISLQTFRDDRSPTRQPYEQPDYRDDMPGWRPGQRPAASHSSSYASSARGQGSSRTHEPYYGNDSTTSVHMQDFTSHQRPQPASHYESSAYNSGYGYPQDNYYQRRY